MVYNKFCSDLKEGVFNPTVYLKFPRPPYLDISVDHQNKCFCLMLGLCNLCHSTKNLIMCQIKIDHGERLSDFQLLRCGAASVLPDCYWISVKHCAAFTCYRLQRPVCGKGSLIK